MQGNSLRGSFDYFLRQYRVNHPQVDPDASVGGDAAINGVMKGISFVAWEVKSTRGEENDSSGDEEVSSIVTNVNQNLWATCSQICQGLDTYPLNL